MFRRTYSVVVLLMLCVATLAQDGTKSIKSEEYLAKRPETSRAEPRSQNSQLRNKQRPGARSQVYTVDKNFPVGPPPPDQEYVRIGVTIWRFGPNQCAIPNCPPPAAEKGLIDTSEGTRIDDSAALSTGERVRLALESLSHDGFVYVIDREQFADGTFGDPYLIFPTRSIHNGSNYARPGLQIQLPRAEGCFCVKSRNPQRVLAADNLIVIISPEPLLSPAEIGIKEIPLPTKLATYVSRANKERVHRGTLKDGAGLARSAPEQAAGTKGLVDTEPVLTKEDLPPQNVYQSLVPRGSAATFSLYLRYNSKP
jgi:hypothetical protein